MTKELLIDYINKHYYEDLMKIFSDIAGCTIGEYQSVTLNCEFGSITLTFGKAKEIVNSLNKAAEEYATDPLIEEENEEDFAIKDAFKAGAAWCKVRLNKLQDDLEEIVELYYPDFSNDDFAAKASLEAVRNAFKLGYYIAFEEIDNIL